ncbi:MAG: hypothetical protein WC538_24660 [Thermoanaerobaculia bacterium]
MNRFGRRRLTLVLLPLVALVVLTSHACVTMRMSRGEIDTFFKTNRIDGELRELDVDSAGPERSRSRSLRSLKQSASIESEPLPPKGAPLDVVPSPFGEGFDYGGNPLYY